MAAVTLAKLAEEGCGRFIALAATLALLVGVVHVGLGLGRLGFLLRFLSEPVLAGFISAIRLFLVSGVRDLHTVVVDAGGIDDLDATGEHALRRVAERYADAGIALLLTNVNDRVLDGWRGRDCGRWWARTTSSPPTARPSNDSRGGATGERMAWRRLGRGPGWVSARTVVEGPPESIRARESA